ncbi:unnamed protein product [Linum tenue]|uniref:Fatty acid hydroxylase domain-containing protein n=1 Tax=Linum tenue TaxID=586396 RepID=A0AAV0IG10_9ROSI|nr:unnamed protein product [Linum tenue]
MAFWEGYVSDETMATFAPIVVYWLYAGFYQIMLPSKLLSKYRLHTREEEEKKNLVPLSSVIKRVLILQSLQIATAHFYFSLTSTDFTSPKTIQHSVPIQILQIAVAMFVMDTWQYFGHRYMHHNKFLYRHVHSHHHRLVVPQAVGAMYNHPLEALLLDMGGGVASLLVSGMTPRTEAIFLCLASVKGVDDHCGVWFPPHSVFPLLVANRSAYHDVHHQSRGGKYNFSQPFFSFWDRLMGTHMPYVVLERPGGGYEAKMVMKE